MPCARSASADSLDFAGRRREAPSANGTSRACLEVQRNSAFGLQAARADAFQQRVVGAGGVDDFRRARPRLSACSHGFVVAHARASRRMVSQLLLASPSGAIAWRIVLQEAVAVGLMQVNLFELAGGRQHDVGVVRPCRS